MVAVILVVVIHLIIAWCIYDDFKMKYLELCSEFENSITGKVIIIKEGGRSYEDI